MCALVGAAAEEMVGQPGAVNFVDGQAAIEGKAIAPGALEGTAAAAGQTLSTTSGKAEAVLTPGAFLRLGEQSAVKMVSVSLADTQVEIVRGDAIIETVAAGAGRLQVLEGAARITIERPGIYEFHAGGPSVAVVRGRAKVVLNDHASELGSGRQLTIGGSESRLARTARQDALSQWSSQRAGIDARASVDTAQALVGTNPANWKGPGWYWNPFFAEWGFLPATYTESGPYGETYFSAKFYWEYGPVPNTHLHGYFTPVH
ncbi:MAG TPA: hypothetical protein VMU19_06935 [Bryobacteraceae bacterium]|nr:hypothetical protein [Bryobacteraceae bacterium]